MIKIQHFVLGLMGTILTILGIVSQIMPSNKQVAHIDSIAVTSAQVINDLNVTINSLKNSQVVFVVPNDSTKKTNN